jgi:acetoin utilization deacetylase AcuC-like enzyme
MTTALISHPACRLHETGSFHPECPQRVDVIEDRLLAAGVLDLLAYREAPPVSREQLLRVHREDYLDWLRGRAPEEGLVGIDADTLMGPNTLEAASRAAGAAVLATDLVMSRTVRNAFCNVRPPGHHAASDRAMGFCFYNNIAVGVAHALEAHGLSRVAVFDFDVHHGNGTDVIFAHDSQVLVCSVFQKDLYPFGSGLSHSGLGTDLALPMGSGGDEMRSAVRETLLSALHEFRPEMLFVSAGFDAHASDDVSDQRYSDSDFDWLVTQAMAVASEHASGRLVSVLEGGYDLPSLARCAASHIRILAGI